MLSLNFSYAIVHLVGPEASNWVETRSLRAYYNSDTGLSIKIGLKYFYRSEMGQRFSAHNWIFFGNPTVPKFSKSVILSSVKKEIPEFAICFLSDRIQIFLNCN